MRTLFTTKTFQKEFKLAEKRGKPMKKLQGIVDLLLDDKPLPLRCRPHRLSSAFNHSWECHIEPDWLLIYDITDKEIRLYRTGSHSDLFG